MSFVQLYTNQFCLFKVNMINHWFDHFQMVVVKITCDLLLLRHSLFILSQKWTKPTVHTLVLAEGREKNWRYKTGRGTIMSHIIYLIGKLFVSIVQFFIYKYFFFFFFLCGLITWEFWEVVAPLSRQ